jgi:hypothetical protein
MRTVWWLVIGGVLVLAALLAVLGYALLRDEDDGGTDVTSEVCTPAEATPSAGNAKVQGRALGKGYARRIVIRVTDKQSGAPVRGAKVSVRGTMECPHVMPLYQKSLRETAKGTYRGDYQLIMEGHWKFNVVVRSEQSGATTASFPVTVQIRG